MCTYCGHQRFVSPPPPDPAEYDPDYYDDSDLPDPAERANAIETAAPWGDKPPLGLRGSGGRKR
jgi:hypothetical protein